MTLLEASPGFVRDHFLRCMSVINRLMVIAEVECA